jgi:hypothetical protein
MLRNVLAVEVVSGFCHLAHTARMENGIFQILAQADQYVSLANKQRKPIRPLSE